MDTENAHETESSAMVAGGDGEKGTGEEKRKTGIALLKSPSPTTEAGNHGVTSLEDALSLVEKLDQIAIVGAPSVIPNKDMADFLSRKLARSIAHHPDVRNNAYIRELVDNGFAKRNAQKIVWAARKLSRSIPVDTSVIHASPAGPATTHGSEIARASPATAKVPAASGMGGGGEKGDSFPVAWSDPCGNWSDYVRSLPDALPRPVRTWAEEHKIKVKKEISLKTVRPDLFGREFNKSLNGLVSRSPDNALGRFNPNPIIGKYPGVWDGVGYFDVPETVLAECLPYLAEEGLLEFHKVPLSAVLALEEIRQVGIDQGQIQAYDRNVRPNQKKTP
jgi:hypothetical protein